MPVRKKFKETPSANPMQALTDKQQAYVTNVCRGIPLTTAARLAGYTNPGVESARNQKNPQVLAAIDSEQYKYQKASMMTRKKVMDGMLEAIEMAKIQSDPGVMVSGWREIGRMCGYYAADRKEINVNITAKRAVDKLEMLTDSELLEMIEEDSEAIEGEYSEVLTATQEVADTYHVAAGHDG